MPKLIIHSQDDNVVPYYMGEELFARGGPGTDFWRIHGEHTNALADYPDEFVSQINRIAGLPRHP